MIAYAVSERVATLTIDRPAVKNALRPEEWKALRVRVADAAADASVRALVLTGAGDDFCAGGDLPTMPERLAQPYELRRANLRGDAELILELRRLAKPVIASIDGVAVGAGLSLALACDVRIATTRARFGAPFHRVGLTGDFGLLWLLPQAVGPTQAMELMMSGELVDAERARAMGLVSRVVAPEHLAEETLAYARRLADGPPLAQGLTKQGLYRALEHDLGDMLDWEAAAQASCSRSADAREGVSAFLERRKPIFNGS